MSQLNPENALARAVASSAYREAKSDRDRALVLHHQYGISRASIVLHLKLPRTTVRDWLSGKVVHAKSGRPQKLSTEITAKLTERVRDANLRGMSMNYEEVCSSVCHNTSIFAEHTGRGTYAR